MLFSFDIFLFLEAVVKAALFVVGEVGAIQVVTNSSPVYLRHLRLVWQSRRKSTRPLHYAFYYLIVWHAIRFFTFSSESVSFPFTSISMRSSPYRIRWSSPFRRKGNSGMLRCCKVGAFSFGENLHAYAPLRFAPGNIFPQKPCIRSSLPLWGTWNENDRCDRKTH